MSDPSQDETPAKAEWAAHSVEYLRSAVGLLNNQYARLGDEWRALERKALFSVAALLGSATWIAGRGQEVPPWEAILIGSYLIGVVVLAFLAVRIRKDPEPNPANVWKDAFYGELELSVLIGQADHLSEVITGRIDSMDSKATWVAWTQAAAALGIVAMILVGLLQ